MKTTLSILLFAFLLLPSQIFAQNESSGEEKPQPKFWMGPKIGVDLLTPTIDQNTIKTQFDSNMQIGVFFQFGRKFYFQPEFYYAMHKESTTGAKETNVNTLKIPALVGLQLFNLKVISAHLMAGPQGSFFINETNAAVGKSRQKSNFDLQFGGGVDLLGFITLDVRYSSNLNSKLEAQIQQLNWKNAVNVTMGIKFR